MAGILNVCFHPCDAQELEEWFTLCKGLNVDEIYCVPAPGLDVPNKMQDLGLIVIPSANNLQYFADEAKFPGWVTVFADMDIGSTDVREHTWSENTVMIFGPSHQTMEAPFWIHHKVHIPCHIDTGFYSMEAGAIMMWDWYRVHG